MLKRFPRFLQPGLCASGLLRIVPCKPGPEMASSYSSSPVFSSESSPFTRAVVSSMRRLYPEALADKSFDNTGLLLEAPFDQARKLNNSVLLTIDLTKAVADEAIENKHSVVVAYHPIIFRGLKAITFSDPQQSSLLRLAANGVSVYSPHTAVDTVPGGMADWLCDIATGKLDAPEPAAHTAVSSSPGSDTDVTTSSESEKEPSDVLAKPDSKSTVDTPSSSSSKLKTVTLASKETTTPPKTQHRPGAARRTYSRPTYPSPPERAAFHPDRIPHNRSVVTPSPPGSIAAANSNTASTSPNTPEKYNSQNTGAGRLITFDKPQPLSVLITRIAHAIGLPKGFSIAIPQGKTLEETSVRTIGVCPGSGASVLRGTKADLLFTGEVSHHEALAVIEKGGCVLALFHSNSERGFLEGVMRERLLAELKGEWEIVRKDLSQKEDLDEDVKNALTDETVSVEVSQRDRDPFGIVVLEDSTVEGISVGWD